MTCKGLREVSTTLMQRLLRRRKFVGACEVARKRLIRFDASRRNQAIEDGKLGKLLISWENKYLQVLSPAFGGVHEKCRRNLPERSRRLPSAGYCYYRERGQTSAGSRSGTFLSPGRRPNIERSPGEIHENSTSAVRCTGCWHIGGAGAAIRSRSSSVCGYAGIRG